jgi:hypothetical protein
MFKFVFFALAFSHLFLLEFLVTTPPPPFLFKTVQVPHELDLFARHGFAPISLAGSVGTLKTEVGSRHWSSYLFPGRGGDGTGVRITSACVPEHSLIRCVLVSKRLTFCSLFGVCCYFSSGNGFILFLINPFEYRASSCRLLLYQVALAALLARAYERLDDEDLRR